MHCLTCREEVGSDDKRCPSCRARVRPLVIRPFAYLIVLGLLFCALFIGIRKLNAEASARGAFEADKDAQPVAPKKKRTTQATLPIPTTAVGVPATTTVAPKPTAPIVPTAAEASSVADSATNGCNQSVSYEAVQVLDGDPNTAWRAVGDGRGVKLTLTLSEAKRITEVGLIPGYDKTDQCTGIDRFVQMRRIRKVRWSFDDNQTIEQTFTDDRSLQTTPVAAISAHIKLEILETTSPRELDYTAISDIRIVGSAA